MLTDNTKVHHGEQKSTQMLTDGAKTQLGEHRRLFLLTEERTR